MPRARHKDHNDVVGNLPPGAPLSEWTPSPQLLQYNGRVAEIIPAVKLPDIDEAIRANSRALDAAAKRPPIASAGFKHHSLRRI